MVGDLHEQHLGHGDFEHMEEIARARRLLFDEPVEKSVDLAMAAERGGGDGAGKPAIAVFQCGEGAVAVEQGVERLPAVEHAGEQAGCGGAGGKAGGIRLARRIDSSGQWVKPPTGR